MTSIKVVLPNAEQIDQLKNEVAQLKESNKLELRNSIDKSREIAYPENELEMVEVIEMAVYSQQVIPTSVGYDDRFLYAYSKVGKRLTRIKNGFQTKSTTDLEYGFDFTGVAEFIGTITHVEKTYSGFVVVETIQGTPNRSNIWFSNNFNSGFTKVLSLDRGRVAEFNFTAYHSGTNHNNVLMVSEYTTNKGNHVAGQEARLFISTDGGATWRLIRTLRTGVNPDHNIHMHTQVYDPYDARIYVSSGDHNDHAELVYSDDLGESWITIPLSTYTSRYPGHHPQPTMMVATPTKIVTCPDNGLPGGVLSLIKDRKYTLIPGETFTWEYEHAAYPHMNSAAGKFALGYIKNGKEIYFVVPSWPGHKRATIVGSGDVGNSWYNLGALNLTGDVSSGEARTIVGVDVNGYMYVVFSSNKIAKYKPAKWVYR